MSAQQALRDSVARLAAALGNGHRLALIERLAQSEAAVETLVRSTGLSVANTSQHLQHLRRAGLVAVRRDGTRRIYRLSDERIVMMMSLLRELAAAQLPEVERQLSALFPEQTGGQTPMNREQLLQGLRSGELLLLDVRPEDEFAAGHLPDAINMPLARLEEMISSLPADREIVAYCRGPWCTLSFEAEQFLRAAGFAVRRYEEGFPEWKAAGLPLAAGVH